MVDGMYVQGMASDDFDYDHEVPASHFSEIDFMDETPCAKTNCRWWNKKAEQNCGGMTSDGDPAIADCLRCRSEEME